MGFTLNGKDNEFNKFEIARAWGVTSIMFFFCPVLLFVIYRFFVTRNNYEMWIRNPNALIMAPWFIFARRIFEALSHFALDLDLAVADWDLFEAHRHSTSLDNAISVFNCLSNFSFTLCGASYFYRVWMFWEKNRRAKGLEDVSSGTKDYHWDSETTVPDSTGTSRLGSSATLRNPLKVSGVLCIWLLFINVPYCRFFEISTHKMAWLASMGLPMIVGCIILLHDVQNTFGILQEYKVLMVLLIMITAFNFLIGFIPFLRNTYYDMLADFFWRALLFDIYFLWLARFIKTFAIETIEEQNKRIKASNSEYRASKRLWKKRRKKSAKEYRANGDGEEQGYEFSSEVITVDEVESRDSDLMMKPGFDGNVSSPGSVYSAASVEDISLPDILNKQEKFEKFLRHSHETLCSENLLFFVDVYVHRRNLPEDPFLKKVRGETTVLQECASLKMDWIHHDHQVLTVWELYRCYIKTYSPREVNIPGQMKKKIMAHFGDGRKTKRSKVNTQKSLDNEMVVSSMRSERMTKSRGWMVPKMESINQPISLQQEGSSSLANHADLSLLNTGASNRTVAKADLQLTNQPSLAENPFENNTSIELLYPVWKTLVNLLKNDTLVRFKRKNIEYLEST